MKLLSLLLTFFVVCAKEGYGTDHIVVYDVGSPDPFGGPLVRSPSANLYAFDSLAAAQNGLVATNSSGNSLTVNPICNVSRNPCHSEAQCSFVEPSIVICTCKNGYKQGSTTVNYGKNVTNPEGTNCTDIDECMNATVASSICGIATNSCINKPGSYECTCNIGYQFNATTKQCEDIDECMNGANDCDGNATCNNTEGGFACTCNIGYTGNGTYCTGFDQCTDPRFHCGANGTCNYFVGGYNCTCDPGYQVDNSSHPNICVDTDECNNLSHDCDGNATCANTAGGYVCTCKSGFSGDGKTCADIDECMSSPCAADATCHNTVGSYSCSCNSGFAGDGFTCTAAMLSYCFRMELNTTGGTPPPTPATVQTDVTTIIKELSLVYQNITVTYETSRTMSGQQQIIVLVCVNGTGTNEDQFAALLKNHTTATTVDGANVTSMDDFDECSENYGNCSDKATCTNTNGSFSCACISSYFDASPSGSIAGSVCEYPVNFTCSSDGVEVWAKEAFFTNLTIVIADMSLGSCSGTDMGSYWVFNGSCNSTTSNSADGKNIEVKWNLTNDGGVVFTDVVTYPITCSFPTSQNISFSVNVASGQINGDSSITNPLTEPLKLEVKTFAQDDFQTALPSTVRSGEIIYYQVSTPSVLPSNLRFVLTKLKTCPVGDSSKCLTFIENGCRVSSGDAGRIPVDVSPSGATNGGSQKVRISVAAHFFGTSRNTEVHFDIELCSDDGTGSCVQTCVPGKRKRSVAVTSYRFVREANAKTVQAISAFTRAEDDECDRDCVDGVCVLDAARTNQCVCSDQAYKRTDGTCTRLVLPPTNETSEPADDRTVMWVLIGLAAFLLVLIVVAAAAFFMRRQAANQKAYELTHVNTHAIGK